MTPMPRRRPLLAANWKMHLGRAREALDLVREIRAPLADISSVDVVLCPPFTVLGALAEVLQRSRLALGAQTMHWEDKGAQTGEISPAMLEGLCRYVILGHSERRAMGGEGDADEAIARKARAALAHDLTPILCVGENLEQREAGETDRHVGGQLRSALSGLDAAAASRLVVAYEPIWAIGTGRAASPADANRTLGLTVRATLEDLFGSAPAQSVRLLYGGSVSPDNIASFLTMPEIDGALVGGASLTVAWVELVRRAAAAIEAT
jgi:triosephosphate isomerase (TIM)